jgi:copper oxidase (laccase) domain-containing protein
MLKNSDYFSDFIPDSSIITLSTTKKITPLSLFKTAGIDKYPLITMQQVHKNNVVQIKNGDKYIITETDAMFTKEKKIILGVKHADCLPILIYHPYPVIAVIHAGRAGTELEICAKTINTISNLYRIYDNFNFWLGPRICQKCYQIDKEKNIYYDLAQNNIQQIKNTLKKPKIYDARICTKCNPDLFYSYRNGEKTDRNYSYIMLL